MKNNIFKLVVVLVVLFVQVSSFAASKKKIKITAGVPVEGLSITFDASYDPRLDYLVTGYKIISVAVLNESFNVVAMSPDNDEWYIKLKGSSKKIKAIHDLRGAEPKVWSRLPDAVKQKIAYPLYLPIGADLVIDLFVPSNVDVEKFTHVVIDIYSLQAQMDMKAR